MTKHFLWVIGAAYKFASIQYSIKVKWHLAYWIRPHNIIQQKELPIPGWIYIYICIQIQYRTEFGLQYLSLYIHITYMYIDIRWKKDIISFRHIPIFGWHDTLGQNQFYTQVDTQTFKFLNTNSLVLYLNPCKQKCLFFFFFAIRFDHQICRVVATSGART